MPGSARTPLASTPWQWHGQHLGEFRPPAAHGSAMSDMATAEQAREPVAHAGDTLSALVTVTRSCTEGERLTYVAAILLADLVRASGAGRRWMNGSRRRIAKALRLSEWEVRVGFADLARWGWIEKRPCVERAGAHYRLTTAFAEAVEAAGEEVSQILEQYLPIRSPAVRGVLTARHIGLMDRREAERCMTLGARALRRAMSAALGYKYEGVKRTCTRAMPRRRRRGSGWGRCPPRSLMAAGGPGMHRRGGPSSSHRPARRA